MIKVGCCGFPTSKEKYYEAFQLVETQSTFYNLPKIETARRWREEAPENFEFTMKAWQVITHPSDSPTWRRLRRKPEGEPERYGLLRPTKENLEAWRRSLEVAEALNASIIVLQLPPRLELKEESEEEIRSFLYRIERDGRLIALESRHGSWDRDKVKVGKLLEGLGVIHCVDILKRDPLTPGPIYYFRLHGLDRETNYKYRYSDQDLERLYRKVGALEEKGGEVYTLFNNIAMYEDGLRFLKMVRG